MLQQIRAVTNSRATHGDLKIIDPVWTTAYLRRNHSYLVYDTLFGTHPLKNDTLVEWVVTDGPPLPIHMLPVSYTPASHPQPRCPCG